MIVYSFINEQDVARGFEHSYSSVPPLNDESSGNGATQIGQ